MRIVAYEWCSSGGLSIPPGERSARDPREESGGHRLAREGRAMLEAIAADVARDPSLDLTVLVEDTLLIDDLLAEDMAGIRLPARVRHATVPRGGEIESLVSAARGADWAIIIAPETDGILASRVAAVRAAGGRPLAPSATFLAIASDKQATADALAAAGVPLPAGRPLAAFEPVPSGFRMPAVRKARAAAGGDGLLIVRSPDVPPSPVASRLESFVEGTPVGVAILCGPEMRDPLPPFEQAFSRGASPRYLGGRPLASAGLRERAIGLADRAVAAVMRAAEARHPADRWTSGWVGVDMILGPREDGGHDRVLELNPRVTTSFVGLAVGQPRSLVATMIEIAEGSVPTDDRPPWSPGSPFAIDGIVAGAGS